MILKWLRPHATDPAQLHLPTSPAASATTIPAPATTSAVAYASGIATRPLDYRTVGNVIDEAAQRFADREALVSRTEDTRLTYAQLRERACDTARAMIGYGLITGDRAALWAPNMTDWVIVQLAAAKAGIILVTVNPAYRAGEVAFVLRHSGARVLFSARRFRDRDYTADFTEIRNGAPMLEHIAVLGAEDGAAQDGFESLARFTDRNSTVSQEDLTLRAAALSPEDPINIQYTSGTTGQPKGATLTHHNIVNNAIIVGAGQALREGDRMCVPVPFFHCFGNVLGTLSAAVYGCAMILPGEAFDPKATLEAIHHERCTVLYSVPMMFIAMLNHPDFDTYDLTSLRTGVTGAAPCPTEVMRDVVSKMHMHELTICYGMTETSPISTQTRIGDDLEHQCETVGAINPHLECKIVDPKAGATLRRGEEGEYCVRGYSVMAGYWENPEATAEAIDRNGWMHSGDLAVMRDDGYIQIVGRAKDIIIRGGENIQPRDIEEFFHTLAEVEDVQVIGVPDETYGEAVCAWIKLTAGASIGAEELRNACRGKIATYKIPKHIRFVDEFPVTASGKVQKFRMREIMIKELENAAKA